MNQIITETSINDGNFIKAERPGEFEMEALFPGHKLAQLVIIEKLINQVLFTACPESGWADWEINAEYCDKNTIRVRILKHFDE